MKVLGLISGTSMDGIDAAVAELRLAGDTVVLTPLDATSVPYPRHVHADLLAALPPRDCTAAKICQLDTWVGQAFANAAAQALARHPDLGLVASLGQTIYHWVEGERCLGTLQLGQPAWIAEATGLPIVADMRARDVARGGHGAPLAAILDALWLGGRDDRTWVGLNLGGIANITVVAPGREPIAYDTGPGNALLDLLARRVGLHQDEDGELAADGTVQGDLLELLLQDPYYGRPAPKSTGKELFHVGYLDGTEHRVVEDVMATLVELTAVTVADACRKHGADVVVASGGGVRNPVLMRALRRQLAPAELCVSDDFGLPSDAKEGYLTALLGFLTWQGVPANGRLLGSLTPGRGPLRPPPPPEFPVTKLRVEASDASR
ncbi:anhydro-N-acetylmuramic acid kinase [Kutzneria buriramensis]|uniref:Anhydro-N-acetylmuramic acid kinase n=1 Tax=Kutzneria buriramensis TaxID=1045776 RepID=A0A3E0HBM0_9PSEU|nr:anhydro-N-acetylmuramic acid kinase [Kutzneria buriramensis]REH41271.1 anhydro-N-acetylmuramic acid kinase [Kutzneria buriramensis]